MQNDNVTLLTEENYLREVTNKLMTDIEFGKQMDDSIEQQIQQAQMDGIDDDKIAFVGPNTLATTTLFKILAGEMEPDEGEYKWGITTSQSYLPTRRGHLRTPRQSRTA